MKFRYVAAVFLIITLSGSLPGIASAQETGGQQVTNGAINLDPTKPMSFSWSPSMDTTKYEFALARDAAMTQIIVLVDVTAPTYEYNGILDYSTNYFWRVRALEPAPSDWSATFSFQTKAAPPGSGLPTTTPYIAPQLLAPSNGYYGCPVNSVSFSWSPFRETTEYLFILAKDSAMTLVVKNARVPATAYQYTGTLDHNSVYFWRVMAREPAPSDWSPTFSFTTESTLPAPNAPPYYGIQPLAPNNGRLGFPVYSPSFSWSSFKDTTKYKFILAKDAAMTNIIAEVEVPATAFSYNGTLDYSTNYFWRVKALVPEPCDWSATFAFQTEASPIPPPPPRSTGMSCTRADIGSPAASLDLSPLLLGGILLGLVIASRRRPMK
jgi:hypothetical protein